MWRWIFGVGGGVLVLRVAADALAQVYRERPLSTVVGCALIAVVLVLLGAALLADGDGGGRIELRPAAGYGAQAVPDGEDQAVHLTVHVEHHHVVEHVHRHVGGQARADGTGGQVPPVVEGVVVRAIESRVE